MVFTRTKTLQPNRSKTKETRKNIKYKINVLFYIFSCKIEKGVYTDTKKHVQCLVGFGWTWSDCGSIYYLPRCILVQNNSKYMYCLVFYAEKYYNVKKNKIQNDK